METAKTKRSEISEINKLASAILEDRKKSNYIVDLIDKWKEIDETNEQICETLLRCLAKIFTYFIDSREMVLIETDLKKQNSSLNIYKTWLIKLYETVIDLFLGVISSQEKQFSFNIQKLSLLSIIKFIEEEGKFPFRKVENEDDVSFPVYILKKLVKILVSETVYNQDLINIFSNYYEYDDFIYFTLMSLLEITSQYNGSDNNMVMMNIIDFIYPIRLIAPTDLLPKALQPEVKIKKKRKRRSGPTGDHKTWIRLCELQPIADSVNYIKLPTKKFKFDYVRDAKLYSSVWLKYLTFDLPPSTYKRALLYLDKFAIQHFENPLLLSDFLISSFQTGGIISLLSLSPLYVLMHKCNLEYPDFFCQLFTLLEPAMTYVKYRARFLFWCDLFLTSTHISSQIVASFAKKLARLAITSPPDTILIILQFVGNIYIRHPTTQTMLIRKEFVPENDPFDSKETDPEKTNAIHSYMWELKLLHTHYLPEVCALSKQIIHGLPKTEWNLENVLENNIDDIIDNSRDSLKKVKKLTYDISCDLFYSL